MRHKVWESCPNSVNPVAARKGDVYIRQVGREAHVGYPGRSLSMPARATDAARQRDVDREVSRGRSRGRTSKDRI